MPTVPRFMSDVDNLSIKLQPRHPPRAARIEKRKEIVEHVAVSPPRGSNTPADVLRQRESVTDRRAFYLCARHRVKPAKYVGAESDCDCAQHVLRGNVVHGFDDDRVAELVDHYTRSSETAIDAESAHLCPWDGTADAVTIPYRKAGDR